jgi:RHS repeat-associated protein
MFDPETALGYNFSRYLQTSLGRFTIRDLTGYGDGADLYACEGNNPVNALDPLGEKRYVFAFEGLGGYSPGGERIIRNKRPGQGHQPLPPENKGKWSKPWLLEHAIQDVIALLPDTEWKYYAQDDVAKAFADGKAIATQVIGGAATRPSTRATTGPGTRSTSTPTTQATCYHTIIVLGFSNGGKAAVELADKLGEAGISVNLGFSIDLVRKLSEWRFFGFAELDPLHKPKDTEKWFNYYQNLDIIHGRKVVGATNGNQNVNERLRIEFPNDNLSRTAHRGGRIVELQNPVRDTLKAAVLAVPVTRQSYTSQR